MNENHPTKSDGKPLGILAIHFYYDRVTSKRFELIIILFELIIILFFFFFLSKYPRKIATIICIHFLERFLSCSNKSRHNSLIRVSKCNVSI